MLVDQDNALRCGCGHPLVVVEAAVVVGVEPDRVEQVEPPLVDLRLQRPGNDRDRPAVRLDLQRRSSRRPRFTWLPNSTVQSIAWRAASGTAESIRTHFRLPSGQKLVAVNWAAISRPAEETSREVVQVEQRALREREAERHRRPLRATPASSSNCTGTRSIAADPAWPGLRLRGERRQRPGTARLDRLLRPDLLVRETFVGELLEFHQVVVIAIIGEGTKARDIRIGRPRGVCQEDRQRGRERPQPKGLHGHGRMLGREWNRIAGHRLQDTRRERQRQDSRRVLRGTARFTNMHRTGTSARVGPRATI